MKKNVNFLYLSTEQKIKNYEKNTFVCSANKQKSKLTVDINKTFRIIIKPKRIKSYHT